LSDITGSLTGGYGKVDLLRLFAGRLGNGVPVKNTGYY
jgi:hypothetical protein